MKIRDSALLQPWLYGAAILIAAALPFSTIAWAGLKFVPLPGYIPPKKVAAGGGYNTRQKTVRQPSKKNPGTAVDKYTQTAPDGTVTQMELAPGTPVVVKDGTVYVNTKPDSLPLRLGRRVGRLVQSTPLPSDTASTELVVTDFNGDGIPDVAAVAYNGNTVQVYLTQDDDSLGAAVPYQVGSGPLGVVAADFNQDGHTDLAVVNSNDNTVSVLFGNGDGTFQTAATYPAGINPWSLATADFNSDGIPDLVIADCGACDGLQNTGMVSLLLGQPGGKFSAPSTIANGGSPVTVIAADINGDGIPDVTYGSLTSSSVTVLPGTGKGTFAPPVNWNAGALTYYLGYGDFNGDGNMDLAVLAFGTSTISILLGTGGGSLATPVLYVAGTQALNFSFCDLRGIGAIDITVQDTIDGSLVAMPAIGNGAFDAPQAYPTANRPSLTVSGDFNGDGQPDFVTSESSALVPYLNTGSGAFQPSTSITTLPGNASALVSADFNGDGKADLAVGTGNSVGIYLGEATGAFTQLASLDLGSGVAGAIAAADVNGDGNVDLIVGTSNSNQGSVAVYLGDGKGSFKLAQIYAAGMNPVSIAVADLNGDGKPDLAICDNGNSAASAPGGLLVMLNQGGGAFGTAVSYPAGSYPVGVAAGDLNGDGKMDLAVASNTFDSNDFEDGALAIFLGTATGAFPPATFVGIDSGSVAIAITDINLDGVPDILVTNCCGLDDLNVLLGNGDGSTFQGMEMATGDSLQGIAVADFNGDGRPDFVIASQAADGVAIRGYMTVFLNFPFAGPPVLVVNAESLKPGAVVAGSTVEASGTDLATAAGATQVQFVDAAGNLLSPQVFSASPSQVKFQIPAAAQPTIGTALFTSGDGSSSLASVILSTQEQLTITASPAAGGTVTPPNGSLYAPGTVVPITATPASGYQFTGWTGPVASASSASTTVTMNAAETVTANFSATGHPAFFSGEDFLSGTAYYLQFPNSNLFGYYEYLSSSILYHFDMGFEAFIPGTGNQIYFYDFASGHWWYSSPSLFPYLYDFTLNTFIYYFPDTKNPGHYTTNPRYFSNLTTGKIFTM